MAFGIGSAVRRIRELFNTPTYRNSSLRYRSPWGSAYDTEWQKGGGGTRPWDPMAFPAAEACIGRISEAVAAMPILHERQQSDGSRERVQNSPIERTLRKPNSYQTGADLMALLMRAELVNGNAYAVRVRNSGRTFDELHPLAPHSVTYFSALDAGTVEVFYRINGSNQVVDFETDVFVPGRDMLHLRRNALDNPLDGRSPLEAAAASIAAGSSINMHQAAFYANMSRPSGVLSTDKIFNKDQAQQLRELWEAQSTGMDSGRIPILSGGLKWSAFSLSAADADLVNAYQLTVQDVTRAFGVPPAVVGDLTHASYSTTDALIQHWLATSLGATLERIEQSLEDLFGFGEGDRVADRLRFDTDALLRTDFKTLVETLAIGIRGGVVAVNEARRRLYLPPVEYGDEVRVQQQDVPLSAWHIEQEQAANAAATEDEPGANDPASDDAAANVEDDEADQSRTVENFRRAFEAEFAEAA